MKIVWSNGAKRLFPEFDERYQRRIIKLAELMTARHRPDIKKYRRQVIISRHALATRIIYTFGDPRVISAM